MCTVVGYKKSLLYPGVNRRLLIESLANVSSVLLSCSLLSVRLVLLIVCLETLLFNCWVGYILFSVNKQFVPGYSNFVIRVLSGTFCNRVENYPLFLNFLGKCSLTP